MDYIQADLLHLPDEWVRAFDLVVEIFTVQALPLSLRHQAAANVAQLVAPGGTLLVVEAVHDEEHPFRWDRRGRSRARRSKPSPLTAS